jgi:alpha-ketoglutarate-dependent taurine dioxygenase
MIDLAELKSSGWTRVPDISSREALLDLARSLGTPVVSPTGELVKEIKVTSAALARAGTLTANHGAGEFPLHTDTAFWQMPARYVVLRVRGDTRRATTILPFEDLLRRCGSRALGLLQSSVWLIKTRTASFYSPMRIRGSLGWRYDAQCMLPANRAAIDLQGVLDRVTTDVSRTHVAWMGDEAVVLSNWRVLHGRSAAPEQEQERILQRIYVR